MGHDSWLILTQFWAYFEMGHVYDQIIFLGTSYGTSGLGTEPHSLTSSDSYSLEDLSRGLRMSSTEAR